MSAAPNAASINGTLASAASQPSNATNTRAQLKMNTSGKQVDGARKQAGSPIDNAHRKPTQKAWTGNNNSITQRASNMAATNGVVHNAKPAPSPKTAGPSPADSTVADKHATDRMWFLFANVVGLPTTFTTKNGEKYSGIFSSASLEPPELRYVFKMVKKIQLANGNPDPSDEYIGVGEHHVMSLDIVDVVDLDVPNVKHDKVQQRNQNGVSTPFQTDAAISGNLAVRERQLQPWQPSESGDVNMSLESSGKQWDQFEANERLYGVKSNYDEKYYTTEIDRNNPLYKQRVANADRIAREIEGSTSTNAHIAEERGLVAPDDSGLDEEEKYSGVRRDFPSLASGQPDKYTPPARRPPTGQATVPGAPVDPAIISASIARPQSSKKPATPKPEETTQKAATAAPANVPASEKSSEPEKVAVSVPEIVAPVVEKNSPPKPQEATQKPNAGFKPGANAIPPPARKSAANPDNATANVEQNLLESFKQFSSTEKLRVQECQRSMARADKAVKLNDLKKFSEMFKLNTPVPTDLVPILAKDETKQQEIVNKALRQVEEAKTTPTKPAPVPVATDSKAARTPTAHTSPNAPADKMNATRQRQTPGHYPTGSLRTGQAQNIPPRSGGQASLSQRLAVTSQQHKAGINHPAAHPLPIQDIRIPSGPSSGAQTPSSGVSTRFNAKAMEFKPNPAANTFTPGGNPSNSSSPRLPAPPPPPPPPARPDPKKIVFTSFFGNNKPSHFLDPSALDTEFNPIKRMKEEAEEKDKAKDYSRNGGIPNAYDTKPRWVVYDENIDKKYVDCFQTPPQPSQPISAPHAQLAGPPMPHQHQLPVHLQLQQAVQSHMNHNHTPHHTPRHPPAQPHHGPGVPHFEGGHPMQFSASQSAMHPSPRAVHPYAYSTQVQQGMPPGAVFQQPMPGFGMSPGMHHASIRQPGAPQYMPVMGGHMMTNNPSNGPYMVPSNPQAQMYSPAPNHVYPHHGGGPMTGPPGSNGYPSPRPHGATVMSHQSSQQGHPPQPQMVFMQAGGHPQPMQMPQGPTNNYCRYFPQHHQTHHGSPHQVHHYPQQSHRGTPSATYSQPMMPPQSMPPHGPVPAGAHAPNGDDSK